MRIFLPQIKNVIVAERNCLTPIKVLISNAYVRLELFEDSKNNLFLSSNLADPEGIVYYATTSLSLCEFVEGAIILQTLFDRTPSLFVEITNKDKTALYSRSDIDVELKCGDKSIQELSEGKAIEVW